MTYGELGCVVDMRRGRVYPPMRYQAILGRGYWEPFEGDPGPVLKLAEGAFDTVMAAGYVESQHPRDPGGEGGGQWIPKGTTAADEKPRRKPEPGVNLSTREGTEMINRASRLKGGSTVVETNLGNKYVVTKDGRVMSSVPGGGQVGEIAAEGSAAKWADIRDSLLEDRADAAVTRDQLDAWLHEAKRANQELLDTKQIGIDEATDNVIRFSQAHRRNRARLDALTAAFDESKVKRVAKGTANKKRDPKEGGQFTEKDAAAGGTGTDDEKAAEEFAAKLVEFEAAREPVSAERAAAIEALKKDDPSAAVTVIGSTQLDFFDFETGEWDADRRNAHHVAWEIEALVEGQTSENPTALFMAGGSGTGKSTLKDDLHLDPDHAVQVNPDVQKEFHPEYIAMNAAAKAAGLPGDPLAAPYVHEESSHVAKQIAKEAILMRSNMTIDGTGDSGVPGHFLKKIDAARAAGYAVEVIVVDTPVDIALARAEARFRSKGRAVDANDLKHIHKNVAVQFEDWHTKVDDWRVYANDGKRGEQELIAYREKGGDVIVMNEARFNQFRKKGKG